MKKIKEQTGKQPADISPPNKIKVKRSLTLRFYMMVLGGGLTILGLVFFVIYFMTLNMVVGAPSIFMLGGGGGLFYYYWKKDSSATTEFIGEVNKKQVNCLNIYPAKLLFEDMVNPVGFPWECLNDSKRYYVNIWDEAVKRLVPFVLPDQMYYDPRVFAERVLGLPAHKKLFTRKPKLLQQLKTVLLVLAIGIIWILILTTTPGV